MPNCLIVLGLLLGLIGVLSTIWEKKDLEKNKKRELLIMESREKLSLILNKGFESYISE